MQLHTGRQTTQGRSIPEWSDSTQGSICNASISDASDHTLRCCVPGYSLWSDSDLLGSCVR